MTPEEFWNIFALYEAGEVQEARRQTMGRRKEYTQHFDDCLRRAHSWDLWGAAYIIFGGCSDEAFSDFKGGLLLQGREVFEKVLADPEALIELSERMDLKDLLEGRFGSSGSEEPSGEPWSEEADDLKNRFPQLWKRFGDSPVR